MSETSRPNSIARLIIANFFGAFNDNAGEIAAVLEKMAGMGLPNLFIPKKDSFVKVDKIPVLGTGKVDLRGKTALKALCPST